MKQKPKRNVRWALPGSLGFAGFKGLCLVRWAGLATFLKYKVREGYLL